MTSHNTIKSSNPQKRLLLKRILIGAFTALVLISIFLYGVNNPKQEWGTFWMIKPLLLVPIAGALGGLLYHLLEKYRNQKGWWKIVALAVSVIGYIFILWIGTVLGLNGTLWD